MGALQNGAANTRALSSYKVDDGNSEIERLIEKLIIAHTCSPFQFYLNKKHYGNQAFERNEKNGSLMKTGFALMKSLASLFNEDGSVAA